MNNKELKGVLENHMHWLKQDCKGWESMHADLSYVDLSYVDLRGSILHHVSLCGADLLYANLSCANLSGANLCGANLSCANLSGANLSCADLSCANLRCADLSGSILHHANLYGANLYGTILYDAKRIPYIPLACPEAGSFIGFKKAGGFIIKLEIPKDAKRLSATTNKCRCNKAKVLEIQNVDGTTASISEVPSDYDKTFIYKVGETVTVMGFDDNRWNECSAGIHFFINRQDAVNYF